MPSMDLEGLWSYTLQYQHTYAAPYLQYLFSVGGWVCACVRTYVRAAGWLDG